MVINMKEAAFRELLAEPRFDFVRAEDKAFMVSFNEAMQDPWLGT